MEHTQETIEKAIELAKSGKSAPYISDSLGVPYNTVKAWVKGYYPIVRHPDELKEKARKLISQGNNKLRVAALLGVPYSTLVKWKVPVSNEYRKPQEGLKEKVREMVLSGASKVQASFRTGVSLRTVSNWTADIPRNRIAYPQKLRHKIRYLVKKGMPKTEIAKTFGVGYTTVTRWTTDLHGNDSKISGRYFLILRELIENGYIIAKRREVPIYHTDVMIAVCSKFAVVCLESIREKSERDAVESALASSGHEIVSISPEQMSRFVCNVLEVADKNGKKFLLISKKAADALTENQKKTVEKYCEFLISDVDTIERYGGGGIRCMVADVRLKSESAETVAKW